MEYESADFGPVISPLTIQAALPPLDTGQPDKSVYDTLKGLTIEKSFIGQKVKDESMARCCLSGLWLLHGYLDQSHQISQQVGSPTGSFWHGIIHRREGDYGNSKYWFRRVGHHPIWLELLKEARKILNNSTEIIEFPDSGWDPFRLVDLCEEFCGTTTEMENHLRKLQMREWELLFAYSYWSAL